MAFLGYPREHRVPRETWRLWRTQPNPAKILTLEPELAVQLEKTRRETQPFPAELRAQAACDFRYSASNASPFFHTCKVMAAILRAKVSRAISGRIPLARRWS